MTLRTLATIAAVASMLFGIPGLLIPDTMTAAFGVRLDATSIAVARLACASYIGFAVLNWLARDISDAAAWRAISIGNAAAWGISAVVVTLAVLSGLGSATSWALVAMEVVFTAAWLWAYSRSTRLTPALTANA